MFLGDIFLTLIGSCYNRVELTGLRPVRSKRTVVVPPMLTSSGNLPIDMLITVRITKEGESYSTRWTNYRTSAGF